MGFFKKHKQLSDEQHTGNNPYLNGRQEWLERYGSYIQRAGQWRMTAMIALVLGAASVSCNIIQAMQVKAIPYIIEVDKLGKAAVVARADQVSSPPLRLIQSEIAACIVDWRTVTADVALQKQMIQRLSYFFTGAAKGVIKEWYTQNNPYEVAQSGKLIHVEVKSLPLPVSSDSYRVEWTETVRSHTGVALEAQRYEATVSIHVSPPTSEAVLLHNPAGLYITQISASRVLR